jgi:hypothetical protein
MDYTVTIRFDDDTHSLSASSGLPVDLTGEVLVLLSKAVGFKKEEKFTLSEVRGNCYAISFVTDSEPLYCSIETVHKKYPRIIFPVLTPIKGSMLQNFAQLSGIKVFG